MISLKDLELYELLKYDGVELGEDEYKTLLDNKCFICDYYMGESKRGSIWNIELIHGNDMDVYLV